MCPKNKELRNFKELIINVRLLFKARLWVPGKFFQMNNYALRSLKVQLFDQIIKSRWKCANTHHITDFVITARTTIEHPHKLIIAELI